MHHPSIALRLAVALSLLATAWPCLQEMAFAAVPEAINFQGIARRPDGTPISSQAVKIRATILRTAANGTIVYQETLTATTSAGGQFSIQLGTGLLVQGVFTTINWSAFPHFLRIEIDPAGGNAFVDMGTQQLLSVPYAEHAKTSDTTLAVTGTAARVPYFSTGTTLGNSPLYVSGSFVGIGDPTPAYALDVTGTVHSTLNLRADQDAIVVGDVTAGGNVNGVGGTFSGNVSVTGNATVNGGKGLIRAPTGTQLKYYTREAAFAFSLAAGATVSGSIGFGAFTTPPKVWMGNIVTGTGDFSKVMITLYNVGTNSCDIRFYNPGSATVTLDATWQFMAIGE